MLMAKMSNIANHGNADLLAAAITSWSFISSRCITAVTPAQQVEIFHLEKEKMQRCSNTIS